MSSSGKETPRSSAKKFYSSHRNPDLIHQATLRLLEMNIEDLLGDIYDESNETGIFGHPEVRIGLSLKLLHNLRVDLNKNVLKPVIRDIERLMNDRDYLESTGDARRRYQCLNSELDYVHRYIDFDDSITLNTVHEPDQQNTNSPEQSVRPSIGSFTTGQPRNNPAGDQCNIV